MQRAMYYRDAKKEFGAANSLRILLKIQGATYDQKYKEKFGKINVLGRMHGDCHSAAGGRVLCATVTRTAGDINGTYCNVLTSDMPEDDEMAEIAKEKVEVKQINRITGDDKMPKIVKENVKAEHIENTWREMNCINRE